MDTQAGGLLRAVVAGCAAGLAVYGIIGIAFGKRLGKAGRYVAIVVLAACLGAIAAFAPFVRR